MYGKSLYVTCKFAMNLKSITNSFLKRYCTVMINSITYYKKTIQLVTMHTKTFLFFKKTMFLKLCSGFDLKNKPNTRDNPVEYTVI